jgi:hypothetical protein
LKDDGVVSAPHLDEGQRGVVGEVYEGAFEAQQGFAFACIAESGEEGRVDFREGIPWLGRGGGGGMLCLFILVAWRSFLLGALVFFYWG